MPVDFLSVNLCKMKKIFNYTLLVLLLGFSLESKAQGPPITADKPIMLGSKSVILKTLTEIRSQGDGLYTRVPLMIHYLPTSNSLIAIHVPYIKYNPNKNDGNDGSSSLGDIQLLLKYQFFRRDWTAKTFRIVAKAIQNFPTGPEYGLDDFSFGKWASYTAVVAGYETIKHGISAEMGYQYHSSDRLENLFKAKLGFGLPLLKPLYPVNQINLYFEYGLDKSLESDDTLLSYAQGLQYAKGRLTLEAAIKVPLYSNQTYEERLKNSIFIGTRYIF